MYGGDITESSRQTPLNSVSDVNGPISCQFLFNL
jgi:hypothetical protein